MSQSKQYFARISTKAGFCRVWKASSVLLISLTPFPLFFCLKLWFLGQVRVPFSAFRPVNPEDPPLDPFLVHTLTIRFEPKRQVCLLFPTLQQLFLGDWYVWSLIENFHSLVSELAISWGFSSFRDLLMDLLLHNKIWEVLALYSST